ncbi:hypothetical protein AMAG_19633 [Allomyces macrogynus ATCC 38327]|uniref:Uncharacterized protein n=1 Tax=Allomyces macrogynus (strain ATCC 38327) TaxID=578462 RepID=A0A0L0SYY8_ALLM3|nr:hypothetical protein AMAG_19633 [Allomyces macrogynus ATCC 38327]|eukprot:KNE67519.1 hypothetical protein AMAG_19633 [Allomyces macrogynus ATCC 38327]
MLRLQHPAAQQQAQTPTQHPTAATAAGDADKAWEAQLAGLAAAAAWPGATGGQ